MSSTNNVKNCRKVQYSGIEVFAFQANRFSNPTNLLKECNTNKVGFSAKSTSKKTCFKNTNKLTSTLRYNQFKVEWYYLPSLLRYLDYYNVAYTAKVFGLWYILTVDYADLDFALHYYLVIKGQKGVVNA